MKAISYTSTFVIDTEPKRSLAYTLSINYIIHLSIDPATGSPIAALLRLISYLIAQVQLPFSRPAISPIHSSKIVTGGVYKEQGHIHRSIMTCDY